MVPGSSTFSPFFAVSEESNMLLSKCHQTLLLNLWRCPQSERERGSNGRARRPWVCHNFTDFEKKMCLSHVRLSPLFTVASAECWAGCKYCVRLSRKLCFASVRSSSLRRLRSLTHVEKEVNKLQMEKCRRGMT